jgi:hypothetical protein
MKCDVWVLHDHDHGWPASVGLVATGFDIFLLRHNFVLSLYRYSNQSSAWSQPFRGGSLWAEKFLSC